MALTCPVDLDVAILRNEIQTMYARVAAAPSGDFHFHRGPVRDGDAMNLPVDNATVDVEISKGVVNLVPDKTKAVREIARVLKRGGRVQIADIVIGQILPDSALRDIDLWTG